MSKYGSCKKNRFIETIYIKRKYALKGSITIEAIYVMIVMLMLIIVVIYFSFYFYNKVVCMSTGTLSAMECCYCNQDESKSSKELKQTDLKSLLEEKTIGASKLSGSIKSSYGSILQMQKCKMESKGVLTMINVKSMEDLNWCVKSEINKIDGSKYLWIKKSSRFINEG